MQNFLPVHRVFVTGLGVITPLGNSVEGLWNNLIAGKSGIRTTRELDEQRRGILKDYSESFDAIESVKIAGFPDFKREDYGISEKDMRRNDLVAIYGLAAASQAIKDAGLEERLNRSTEEISDPDIGAIIGVGMGGQISNEHQYKTLIRDGPGRLSPFGVPMIMPNAASGVSAIKYGLGGPAFGVLSACATSNDAIIDSYFRVWTGKAKIMVTGGAEAVTTPLVMGCFDQAGALTRNYNDAPQRASRPFDAERSGFVMSEGAAILVLESEDSARERGVVPYAEIIGFGQTNDGYHITHPHPNGDGATRCMKDAMLHAGISPAEVGYINAHGTSTKLNDLTETLAIKNAFGEHADKLLVSSTKSMTGHMIGAAGAVEAVACILALKHGIIPPTINLETPDPECDLNYVPNKAVIREIRVAMNNSFGFGGHNSVTVFRRYEK